jgi:hypothetical protein
MLAITVDQMGDVRDCCFDILAHDVDRFEVVEF